MKKIKLADTVSKVDKFVMDFTSAEVGFVVRLIYKKTTIGLILHDQSRCRDVVDHLMNGKLFRINHLTIFQNESN